MKHLRTFFAFILSGGVAIACNSKADTGTSSAETISTDSLVQETTSKTNAEPDTLLLPLIYNEGIEIQLTGLYRMEEPSDYDFLLEEGWMELYQDTTTHDFHLIKANPKAAKEYDACLDDSSTYLTSLNAIDPLIFIKGINNPQSEIKSVKLKQDMVWCGSSLDFEFNNQKYTLEAEGYVLEENDVYEDEETGKISKWENVVNYRLRLKSTIGNKLQEQLLVAIPSSNDTNVKILFIGDLDNDGKPDFVFDVSRDYEEKAVVLMLSTKAKQGEFVRGVGESSFQFDC